jgi:hypothetical protein
MKNVSLRLALALAATAVVPVHYGASPSKVSQQHTSKSPASLELPLTFERNLGDLNDMKKRHVIRVLVVPSHSGFFYDQGLPHGILYEAFEEFERFANQKLKPGSIKMTVTFIPVRNSWNRPCSKASVTSLVLV